MPSPRHTSTAALLLDLLEAASLGPMTSAQAAAHAGRARHPAVLRRHVRGLLATLEVEGLISSAAEDGELRYRATADGLAALERQGRLPGRGTVLFTDLVNSTRLIEEHGEAGAHELRRRHFALLGAAITAHGGREVKRLGDGVMAVFADPAAATACAAEMQRGAAADPDRLGLRVGVHTGELLRDGDDVYGTTVIVAARLCERAGPGETIVSEATGAAAARPVRSLGALRLKGLRHPVTAFAAHG